MNIPTIVTIFACAVVLLKLLGYIALGWSPILWGIGIAYGFMLLLILGSIVLLALTPKNPTKLW